MAKKKTPPESADKAGASDGSPVEGSMERFKHLTRRLLGVSNRQAQEERQRQEAEKKQKRNTK